MKTTFIVLTIVGLFISCKSHVVPNEVIIEGWVNNVPDGQLYLTEAHAWQIPLDSAKCVNGHFIFRIKPDSSFFPYMASIQFPDSTKSTGVQTFFYRNHVAGADSLKDIQTAFYLEEGYTRIEGDNNSKARLRIFAGKETDLMYKTGVAGFGYPGNADNAKREQRIAFFKREIKKYPYSYFLLQSIYNAKVQYSEKEIGEITALFDEDVKQSALAKQFDIYLVNRTDPGKPYPNLSLPDSSNQRSNIIDAHSRINMLVFWASWCGPCRKEIPLLKEIAAEYGNKGLNLVSISIDEDRDNWIKALKQEHMPWKQYLVDKNKIKEVEEQFNFVAIPLIVLTNETGKELTKFSGYYEDGKKRYEAAIDKFIH